jgi:alkanesulfonate monooxygenase SsuD/methylene tetrahydromethanopterin reductase-like flavin-dependent oxidoreductase (luciferase family)
MLEELGLDYDVKRYQRYREALELCLQFLTSLQYTDVNTVHFADWYRPCSARQWTTRPTRRPPTS